jgi:hypothetical protein
MCLENDLTEGFRQIIKEFSIEKEKHRSEFISQGD